MRAQKRRYAHTAQPMQRMSFSVRGVLRNRRPKMTGGVLMLQAIRLTWNHMRGPAPLSEQGGDAMQTTAQPKAKTVFSVASVQPKLATGGRPAKPWQRQERCGQRIKSKFTLDMPKDKGDKRKPHYVEQRECQCMAVEMIVSKSLWRGVQPRVLMLKAGSATSTAGSPGLLCLTAKGTVRLLSTSVARIS